METVNIGIALIAGLVSFLSPCVLPLVPAYIGYMGGRVTNTVAAQTSAGTTTQVTAISRISTVIHGVMFVLGFTFVFVVFGLVTTAFIRQVGGQNVALIKDIIGRVGGIVIIFFGLHFMGVMPALFRRLLASNLITSPLFSIVFALFGMALVSWALMDVLIILPVLVVFALWLIIGGALTTPQAFWERTLGRLQGALYADTRRQMVAKGEQSYSSSALMGVVFAAGWTPCIGPIYGSILTLAATGSDISGAAIQLIAYSLGLGIPFLLAAILLDSAQAGLRRIQRHLHKVELVSGAFLVLIGVLVASGQLQMLSQTFANQFSDISYRLELCAEQLGSGEIGLGEFFGCVDTPIATSPIVADAGTNGSEAVVTAVAPVDNPMTPIAPTLPAVASISDLAAQSADAITIGTTVGEQAPNFTTTTETGETIQLSDLRGEVVLLNFWATWCVPCKVEMPEFERAYQNGTLRVIAINNRENADQIAAFRDEYSLSFPLAMDEMGDLQALYGVNSYPSTFLIDRNGVIRTRIFGALSTEQIEELLNNPLIASS